MASVLQGVRASSTSTSSAPASLRAPTISSRMSWMAGQPEKVGRKRTLTLFPSASTPRTIPISTMLRTGISGSFTPLGPPSTALPRFRLPVPAGHGLHLREEGP